MTFSMRFSLIGLLLLLTACQQSELREFIKFFPVKGLRPTLVADQIRFGAPGFSCDGSLGQFDVWVLKKNSNYEVVLIPRLLAMNGYPIEAGLVSVSENVTTIYGLTDGVNPALNKELHFEVEPHVMASQILALRSYSGSPFWDWSTASRDAVCYVDIGELSSLPPASAPKELLFDCDGVLGSFDVKITEKNGGKYSLIITPVSTYVSSPVIMIGILNQATSAYWVVENLTVARAGEPLEREITLNDLLNFDLLGIRPASSQYSDWSTVPVDSSGNLIDTVCSIPAFPF